MIGMEEMSLQTPSRGRNGPNSATINGIVTLFLE